MMFFQKPDYCPTNGSIGTCPNSAPACTGGCEEGMCNIDCGGGSCDGSTITCVAGANCSIYYEGSGADTTIYCPDGYACNLDCASSVTDPPLLECGTSSNCTNYCGEQPLAGELVITEIMANPSALADSEGEWFELYNPTSKLLNLVGCRIVKSDQWPLILNSESVEPITRPVVVQPYEYAVFARSSIALGGPEPSYIMTTVLNNFSKVLGLICGEQGSEYVVSEYQYPDAAFIGAGISYGVDGAQIFGTNWCSATSAYGTGDFGTPFADNPVCPP